MTQVLSGHGRIKAYLHRFNIFPDQIFGCDSISYRSWEHIIFDCAVFEGNRFLKLMREVVIEGYGWPPSGDLLIRDRKLEKIFQRHIEHLDFEKILLD